MAADSTSSTSNNLRTPSHSLRALEHNEQPVASLFDDEAAGRDHHLFDNGDASHPFNQDQYQYHNPQQRQPQPLPFESQPQPPQPQDSADWDTRATILLAEVIVVTVIVGTVLFCCLRKHHRRLMRLQQTFTTQQMQEWTTIRIPPHGAPVLVRGQSAAAPGRDDRRVRMDSNASGMISLRSSAGRGGGGDVADRMRVDSGISGMVSVLSAAAAQDRRDGAGSSGGDGDRVDGPGAEADRTALRRLLSVPRTIGSAILYPLRVLEAGVNGWATENYDEAFLRQFMERLEAEQEAARENPDDREIRLKEAFMKECMVWELDDAHFLPPKKLGDENLKPSSPLFAALGGDGHGVKEIHLDDDIGNEHAYGLYNLGKSSEEDDLQYAEEGKVNGTYVQDMQDSKEEHIQDCRLEHVRDFEGVEHEESVKALQEETSAEPLDVAPEVPSEDGVITATDQNNCFAACSDCTNSGDSPVVCSANPEGCQDTQEETPPVDENCLATNNEPGAMEHLVLPAIHDVTESAATILEQPTSPSSVLVGGTSAGTLHSSVPPATMATNAMAEDSFDEDAAPGYLYLNANRRRANTGGSLSTSISSSGHSALSTAESMESASSVAEASQDSHKIPNQCAICLCDYEKGDTIVTSCNGDCPHAFHQECIVEWLVKMQDGTPCPCCRRTFVELDEHVPGAASGGGNTATGNNNNNGAANANVTNNHADATEQDDQEAERLRQARRRRRIELGIQRGRAFNMSVISLRNNAAAANDPNAPQDLEEAERARQVRARRNIELGLRRGGRAFNTSAISLR